MATINSTTGGKMEKQKTDGNEPIKEETIEKIEKVAGHEVAVFYDKDDKDFTNPLTGVDPEGLEGEKLEKWHKEAENEFRMKRSASKKYDKAAERERELDKREEAIKEREGKAVKSQAEFDKRKATSLEVESPEFNKILSAKTGKAIHSKEDLTAVMTDTPELYHEAIMEYSRKSNEALANSFKNYRDTDNLNRMETALFRQRVESEKLDYNKVKAFAELRGFPMNAHTLKSFKLENEPSDIVKEINKSFPKTTEIKWIPQGDVKPEPTTKTLQEEFPSQYELEQYMEKERQKPLEKQDKRVIAAMEKL